MTKVRLLAFDLMDTVVIDPFFSNVLQSLKLPLEQLASVRDPGIWPAFERGHVDEPTFLRRFYLPNAPADLPSPSAIRDAVVTGYRFVDGMPALLSELAKLGRQLWVFSNYPIWFEIVRSTLDLDRYFEGFVVSYETGERKPDPAAYEAFGNRAGHPLEQTLLIDDRSADVEAARHVGMPALQFPGDVQQLRAELIAKGLLSPEILAR